MDDINWSKYQIVKTIKHTQKTNNRENSIIHMNMYCGTYRFSPKIVCTWKGYI